MYKKIILLSIVTLLSFSKVNALRYNNHTEPYSNLSSSPYTKECWYDWDSTGWVWLNGKDRAVVNGWGLTPLWWSIDVGRSSSNMNCIYWDASPASIWINLYWGINNVRTNQDVTAVITCDDRWGSRCNENTYYYRVENNPFACNSVSANRIRGSTIWFTTTTNLVKYICFRWKDHAQTQNSTAAYSYSPVYTIRIDKTPPKAEDITTSVNDNLYANDNLQYEIRVSENWWSPIAYIEWTKENIYMTGADISFRDSNFPFIIPWNIKKIDNAREAFWWRWYDIKIKRVVDSAWNIWNFEKVFNHNVFATNLFSIRWVVTNELIDEWNIADGTEKKLVISLKDIYGNSIIPASWINRNVEFTFNTKNDLYQNEYTKSLNAVFVKTAWSWAYSNVISNNNSTTASIFLDQKVDANDNYIYWFKIYTPTKIVYPKAFWNFTFSLIEWKVHDEITSNTNFLLTDSTFDTKYKPIYYTNILWEVKENGFSEWSVQSWSIKINENTPHNPTTNNKLFIEFWSWDTNQVNNKLNLKYWNNSWSVNSTVNEWNPNWRTEFKNNFTSQNYPIYTKLLMQTWARLNDIQHSYFSTHIWYDIIWANPWETLNISHNSDIYGKSSYWERAGSWNTYESVIKIIWSTYTKKFEEIIEWQSWEEVLLFDWNMSKMELKAQVRKKVLSLVRNVEVKNWNKKIYNFDFSSNTHWVKLLNWDLLYFWSLSWSNVEISWWTITWNKSIIIIWWNAHIVWDIKATNWSILWIAVLQDINGSWWNIYVDPNVTHINASLYADKALISYYDSQELWANAPFYWLRNQLYINWAVFTENTVGWSRSDPVRIPYYMKNIICLANSENCMEDAQKYDLNYLRRYYLKDTDWDWIWDQPAMSWTWFFASWSVNYKYPLIIEYNPLLQTNPPIIFRQY